MNLYQSHAKTVYPFIYDVQYGQMKSINCYLFDTGEQLLLIDAGFLHDRYIAYFDQQLADYGFTYEDIDAIILTHHHEDHTGMLNRILEKNEIPVYAHKKAIERLHFETSYLTRKLSFFEKLYSDYGCIGQAKGRLKTLQQTITNPSKKINAPIIPLQQGDIVYGLQVIEAPGHSPDSIILFERETAWAFSGDLLFKYGTSNALIDFDEQEQLLPTVMQQRHALRAFQQLPVATAFPGHQQPFEDTVEVAQFYIDRIERKKDRLINAVKEGHTTAMDIAYALYGAKAEQQFSLVMSEVIGYATYAEMQGELVFDKWTGQFKTLT